MADWLEAFQVTVPAGTSLPGQVFPIRFSRPATIERIEIVVPDGPAGLMGFQLMFANQVILPLDPSKYIITNDEKINWQVWGKYSSGDWAVRAYNLGKYDHTIYLRFLVNDVMPRAETPGILTSPTAAVIGSMSG
jgi:hypothetical protein